MANPKAQTLAKRFGFNDPELKTSKHDEILFWVEANKDRLVARLLQAEIVAASARAPVFERWTEAARKPPEEWVERAKQGNVGIDPLRESKQLKKSAESLALFEGHRDRLRAATLPPRPKGRVDAVWEFAIMDRKFTVGFIDMALGVVIPDLAIRNDYGRDPEWFWGSRAYDIYIEAKTSLGSMGELLRQIRMYQEHCRGRWVVCAPDIRYEAALKRQGVDFWKYDP